MSQSHTPGPWTVDEPHQVFAEFCKDGHGGDFEDGEHPYVDKARAAIAKATEAA